jgi:hypothetical protein
VNTTTLSTAVPPLDVPVPPPEPDAAQAASARSPARARDAEAAAAIAAAGSGGDPLSLQGLGTCVAEARRAAETHVQPPRDPVEFEALRTRLERASAKLPPDYRRTFGAPLLETLDLLGPSGFAGVLAADPLRVGQARLLLDACEAVLQRGEGYQPRSTDALQEVVSDLYDGFLSAEARRGVKPPDHGVEAPLVVWGGDGGPSTWPATATEALGVGAGVVTLPAANAGAGLLAWPALAHETAGHDVLDADDGLRDELARDVRRELLAAHLSPALADYWADRIDESAADVMGVLNMGPAAAVGTIGYFRAMNGAYSGTSRLRTVGSAADRHPADLARAYLGAETVRLLSFSGAGAWADRLTAEADRDLGPIRLGDTVVSPQVAKASAAIVARTIVRTPLASLEGRSLGQIQDWRDSDEATVAALRGALRDPSAAGAGAAPAAAGAYAAHAVAAGVYEAVGGGTSPGEVMGRMIGVLDAMHARNPQWAAGGAPPPTLRPGGRPSPTSGS